MTEPQSDEERAAQERAQVEQVFGLTGGELDDTGGSIVSSAATSAEVAAWVEEQRARTRQLPNGADIDEYGYTSAGFGQHRDSDPLAQSNFAVAARSLLAFDDQPAANLSYLGQPWNSDTSDDDEREPVIVASFGHFAYGWVEELLVRSDREDLLSLACELRTCVDEQYPVLDDEDYSEREWASDHPDADELCYSDDDDCTCGRERA